MTHQSKIPFSMTIPKEEIAVADVMERGLDMLRVARQALTNVVRDEKDDEDLEAILCLIGRALDAKSRAGRRGAAVIEGCLMDYGLVHSQGAGDERGRSTAQSCGPDRTSQFVLVYLSRR